MGLFGHCCSTTGDTSHLPPCLPRHRSRLLGADGMEISAGGRITLVTSHVKHRCGRRGSSALGGLDQGHSKGMALGVPLQPWAWCLGLLTLL